MKEHDGSINMSQAEAARMESLYRQLEDAQLSIVKDLAKLQATWQKPSLGIGSLGNLL